MRRSFIALLSAFFLFAFFLFLIAGIAPADASDDTANATPPDSTAGLSADASGKASAPAKSPAATAATTTAQSSRAAGPDATKHLPPMVIVVTATRMPQPLGQVGTTISVVPRQQIQDQQIQTVPDALRQVPGVNVTQTGSPGTVADVSIRGSTPEQTLILLDGVPLNGATTDSFDISRLTTYDLDRIEVVRGAGGALYGSQAIGGVVNMITREGSGPLKFSLLSAGGNDSTESQALTFDGAAGKLAYSGALSYFSTDGFRPINDNSDNLSGALRLDYHLDPDTTIRGFARYGRANVSLASYSVAAGIPLNPSAHQRTELMLYKGELDHHFGEHLLARFSVYYVRGELRLNAYPFAGSPSSESDDIPEETRGGNLDTIYTWARGFRTLAGFEFQDLWARSGSSFFSFAPAPPRVLQFVSAFNARRQQYAGYIEQEGQFFNGHLVATGGFRVDGNSDFGEEASPAWSVAIPLKWGLTLRGSYAEGFRAPSFDELFFPGFGNPRLGPEISSEYDGGFIKTFGEKTSFTATYFTRRVHSLIVAEPCTFNAASCPFGSIAGNAGRADTEGVEIVPSFNPISGLAISGSLTILDQTHRSVTSQARPTRVPKYSAAVLVDYKHSNLLRDTDQMDTAVAYTFVGDRDDITTAGSIANHDAYHRADLTTTYSPNLPWEGIRNEQVFVRVQNLFDRHYSEAFGFPAPPVNVLAGVKLEF